MSECDNSDTDKASSRFSSETREKSDAKADSGSKPDSATKSDADTMPSSETKSDSKVKGDSSPKPKRRLRINRRSYIVDSDVSDSLSTDKAAEKPSSLNGCNDGANSKKQADAATKRIISLSSVKSSTGNVADTSKAKDSPKIITLKKKPITFDLDKKETIGNVISSSADPPPKKKHKPITWP